ncbi:sigma-70 family RNA polymerase sigma factor [Paenibacillus graminis]|uniref:RNA polymerase n=1 Tax=Paenibacillus graminis TaxID=189425 RepID=A0A089M5T0_9BACL|nr:sigma-70 family RNA polymerase sigma factor [Paenibacillus graminis]AIQ68582.1 RNA polymerase [Paenibacillus graminis]
MNNRLEKQVRRAQRGDNEAFIELIQEMELQMYQMAKSIVRKDEDCADAMQESTLKAFKAISTLKQPEFFRTWLFRILINECNMILRRRVQTVTINEMPVTPKERPSMAERLDLRTAVHQLEEIPRTLVILHYYQGFPLQHIADLLEMSEGAVKTRLHRARKTLYEWLVDPVEREMNG